MKKKEIIDGRYPAYSFRIDPVVIAQMEALRGEQSWNLFFKDLVKPAVSDTISIPPLIS